MKTVFDDYINRGLLKKQRPVEKQIEYQLNRARHDLETSLIIIEVDPEWAVTVAYHAMLRAGRALLFTHGHLPADGAQHKTVVELTGKILGSEYSDLVKQFERLRRKRNMFFYESFESASVTEARNALGTATKALNSIRDIIQNILGQQQTNFKSNDY